jgi:hypothetical protein
MTDECNYSHWSYIIFHGGLQCLRQLLDELIGSDINLAEWLKRMQRINPNVKAFRDASKKLHCDDSHQNRPTSDNFDLTLLFKLLKVGLSDKSKDKLGKTLKEDERENLKQILEDLRTKRNTCAHVTSYRMKTELYNKEVEELHEILVKKLSKYKCKPDMSCWNIWPVLQQKIFQNPSIMKDLVRAIRSNTFELQRLSEKVDELRASQQGKADKPGVIDVLRNVMSNLVTKVRNISKWSTIDDTPRSVRDQCEPDIDPSLVDRVEQVDHELDTANFVGKKAAEKERRTEEGDVVDNEWTQSFGSMDCSTPNSDI